MPIYEYTCAACGAAFSELVRSADEERGLRCPKCKSSRLKREMSVPATPRVAAAPAPASPCGRCGQDPGACPFK